MRRSIPSAVALLLLFALAAGCGAGRHPTSPVADDTAPHAAAPAATGWAGVFAGPSSGGFVPLELGNRWRYLYEFSVTVQEAGREPGPGYSYTSGFEDRLACIETLQGSDYVVDARRWDDPSVLAEYILFRQDARGLFERDGVDGTPNCILDDKRLGRPAAAHDPRLPAWGAVAARCGATGAHAAAWRGAWERLAVRRALLARLGAGVAAGTGARAENEIQRLAYPLHVGQRWIIRGDPRFESQVEGRVGVRVGAARLSGWSIRIRSELFGPRDVVRIYWGRDGYLGLRATLLGDAIDENGNVIGTLLSRQDETLVGLTRARH